MDCPFLGGKDRKVCMAVSSTVILSCCELESFCQGSGYMTCPVYRAYRKMQGKKLSLDQYCIIYSLWVRGSGTLHQAANQG